MRKVECNLLERKYLVTADEYVEIYKKGENMFRKSIFIVIVMVVFMNCGGAMSVKDTKEITEKKTGIYIYANHTWLQWILYFSDGLTGTVGTQNITVPWRKLTFIEQAPGMVPYSLTMTYMSGGKANGCLNLMKDQIIYIKYKSPIIVTTDGNIELEDVKTKATTGLTGTCSK